MDIRKAYRYRLYPTRARAERLEWVLRRCQERAGEKPGYPHLRSRDRYDSFTYSQAGWKLTDGRLVLSGIGALKVRWSRAIQGTIKTVTIHRSTDQWYVCVSCLLEVPQPVPPNRPATALDVGCATRACPRISLTPAGPNS